MAEQELKACPIPLLHEAFNAIVRRASQGGAWTGTMPFMSIPARPDVDADLIVSRAIDELFDLRARLSAAEAEVERLRKRVGALADTLYNQHVNHCTDPAWADRGLHAPECDIEDLDREELTAAARRQQGGTDAR